MFKVNLLCTALIVLFLEALFSGCAGFDLSSPVTAVVFEDDFDIPCPGVPLRQWDGISPAWKAVPSSEMGLLQQDTRPVTRQILFAPGKAWTDYTLTCLCRVERWGGQTKNFAWSGEQYRRVYWSVAVRTTDAANCYRLEYAPWVPEDGGQKQSFYRLVKYTAGERVELARVLSRFHSDLDHLVRFEARGSELKAKIWQATETEPAEWTIAAEDRDHPAGTVSFLTANAAVLFDKVQVKSAGGPPLLDEEFNQGSVPARWEVLSGDWQIAPWGKRLVRSEETGSALLSPNEYLGLPAEAAFRLVLGAKGALCLAFAEKNSAPLYRMLIGRRGSVLYDSSGRNLAAADLNLEQGKEYTLTVGLDPGKLSFKLEPYPLLGSEKFAGSFNLPRRFSQAVRIGFDPQSAQVSLAEVVLEATVPMKKALEVYLRYICDWYMSLELPTGYPKTGTGSPELFIASYCARTLMAGGRILDEPAYLEEALRWADFVTSSPSVLVPLVTGTGREALALRTFADWSSCINMADIGSVLFGVGVLCPWGDAAREARYLEVMEKYSLYVTEGCLEDPLVLGRGSQPGGWRVTEGPDRGGFSNGYWWMEKSDKVWDVSTTNVGLQFYPVLYRLTGNEEYRRYAIEAADWYLRKEVDTGNIFEAYHDVIYGGEALITAWEHIADPELRGRIEKALAKICAWIVEKQNPDGTWNQEDTPRNNRTNLIWRILDWYLLRHPDQKKIQQALSRTVACHLDRRNSRFNGVCEVLRKTCFTGVSVAELISPGVTVNLRER